MGSDRATDQARSVMPEGDERSHQADAPRILVMRGLRSLAYGLLSVLLGVALAGAGFSPAAIGVLLTVSLVASGIPALRARHVDAMTVLRDD